MAPLNLRVMIGFTIHEDRHLIGGLAVGPIGRPPAKHEGVPQPAVSMHHIHPTVHGAGNDADGATGRRDSDFLRRPGRCLRKGIPPRITQCCPFQPGNDAATSVRQVFSFLGELPR